MDHAFPNIKHNYTKIKFNGRTSACDQCKPPSSDEGIFCARKCSKIERKTKSLGALCILDS
jgi:hypothetical protein